MNKITILALLCFASSAYAAEKHAPMRVSITIVPSCTVIQAAHPVVECSVKVPYSVQYHKNMNGKHVIEIIY